MEFIKGMDMSTLAELERLGAKYYDHGRERDVLSIMKDCGVNTIRLRLWNDPYAEDGEPYGAGGNDLKTTLAIAHRVTDAGLGVLLDFHYSDFWADPGKQIKPKAWASYGLEELEDAVYRYTADVLRTFQQQSIRLSMMQIGNEVTNGLLWPEGKWPQYDNIARLLNAGIRAAREVDANIPLMIHLANGSRSEFCREWFDEFLKRGEAFDLIGLSYYPFWDNGFEGLERTMEDAALRYGKDVVVAETSTGFTLEDYQQYEKLSDTERKGYAAKPELAAKVPYPMTKEGQAAFITDLMERIRRVPDGHGKGFFWWEPAWLPIPGSGWATKASLAYMNDPGPCGNEWANQALFDYDGNVLPALEAIRDFRAE